MRKQLTYLEPIPQFDNLGNKTIIYEQFIVPIPLDQYEATMTMLEERGCTNFEVEDIEDEITDEQRLTAVENFMLGINEELNK